MPQSKTVTIRFHPQAWIRDQAIACDPEGPVEFEVPENAAKDAAGNWLRDFSYESDVLKEHRKAPRWIRKWHGPFDIEILGKTKD